MKTDDSAWPLAIVTMPGAVNMESIDAIAAFFAGCFARQGKFALVIDTRPVHSIPDAMWRKRLTELINEPSFRAKERRFNVGSATILTSVPVRATMTALHWVWKPASPQYYPADMRAAVEWCAKQLTDAHVPLGDPLLQLRASLAPRAAGAR
jgi:hypothetical protein